MKTSTVLVFLLGAVLTFTNSNSAVAAEAQSSQTVPAKRLDDGSGVWFNGMRLGQAAIDQLARTYGMQPVPGRWWYDPMSGLCGVEGQAAMGFMLPNHDFLGRLSENASNGTSAVFINGRRLTNDEVLFLSYFWQTPIQHGRYWLDGRGFTGIEGVPQPLGNIHLQAAMLARQGAGGGGGGDNFWSSRLGAGNYDPSSGAGYVSVPGHGPIGFGM